MMDEGVELFNVERVRLFVGLFLFSCVVMMCVADGKSWNNAEDLTRHRPPRWLPLALWFWHPLM